MSSEEPLAVIKVIFDELPDDIKYYIHLLIGTGVTCLVLTNIMLLSQLVYFYYSKIRLNKNNDIYYERL